MAKKTADWNTDGVKSVAPDYTKNPAVKKATQKVSKPAPIKKKKVPVKKFNQNQYNKARNSAFGLIA